MSSQDIEATDVIRLIEQFLKENNLPRTLQALQEETTVSLNTVDSIERFTSDIQEGRWDIVLKTISQLKLPQKKLIDLYEQIILELIEMKEIGAARSLLRQTEPMQFLKDHYPERYLNLEHLLSLTYFDEKEAYPNDTTKLKRRQVIAQALAGEVTVVAPARLLSLLGQAAKWQRSQGLMPPDSAYDFFKGVAPVAKAEEDAPPTECYNSIKFPKRQYAESVAFSPDGQCLATGSSDGFIELWNYMNGKLRKDFKYQAEDNLMVMEAAVVCLNFSRDSEHLVSGAQDGKIKVWKISTGQCVKRFPSAHVQGVTSVTFNKDGTQILSSGFDQTIRIHGMKSGKLLKEFRGHNSFVNDVAFLLDGAKIISASSDGTARIWDTKTTECIATLTLDEGRPVSAGVQSPTVSRVLPMPRNISQFIMCNQSPIAYLLDEKGQVVKTFSSSDKDGATRFISAALSTKGEYLYCVAEDTNTYCFHVESGKLVTSFKASQTEIVGIASHPFSNILAIYSDDGVVGLWKQ
ncbi:WD40 repeat-containing protein SMU1-like protein [Phlyctochytrium arcticum]|nr:WD40 repeat-containing protein SMU1-like protein [Phlyctochytrium arcticum]